MSVKHLGLVFDNFRGPASMKLVLLILADHADSDGICWPSYRRIADRANISERQVARHVKDLRDLGVVTKLRTGTIISEGNKRLRVSNAYRVNSEWLLSTKDLCTDDNNVHLQPDTGVVSRWSPVSTKPSSIHQLNRQPCVYVDNSSSETP